MKALRNVASGIGLLAGITVIAVAHLVNGGQLSLLLQPVAALVVFGGTMAAILVSFPSKLVWGATKASASSLQGASEPIEPLLSAFVAQAQRAKKNGVMAIEREIAGTEDVFLARALSLVVTGLPAEFTRQALDLDARACADRDEMHAAVLEAAAGYAPTLGIAGAVLGLMQAMSQISAPADLGAAMACAFVATLYGVGAANLVFLPLATRLRARAHVEARRREFTIDGVLAIGDGLHPRLVKERLVGYLGSVTNKVAA
ncbi:MAG TPA: MotA/TolQ/ExbB proton channel family protein [Vicinamibacterales bacterium]|nr:MotA/TolQ/ExbB proton channel family protein [Vicinamibacterales bacterium]